MAWVKKRDWKDNFKEDPLKKIVILKEEIVEDVISQTSEEISTSEPELIINDEHFEIDTENDTDSTNSSIISNQIKLSIKHDNLKLIFNKLIEEHRCHMNFLNDLTSQMLFDIFIDYN